MLAFFSIERQSYVITLKPTTMLSTLINVLSVSFNVSMFWNPVYSTETIYTSPDGKTTYQCGSESASAMGCFNYWVLMDGPKVSAEVKNRWRPAKCSNPDGTPYQGLCYQGGVAWWYWQKGNIGDAVLYDFKHRDYAGPMINGIWRNDTPKGNARKDHSRPGCYIAMTETYCMVPLE